MIRIKFEKIWEKSLITKIQSIRKVKSFLKAIEDFSAVIEIDPKHYNALYARAACLIRLENFEEAMNDYDKAMETDTTSHSSLFKKLRNSPDLKIANSFSNFFNIFLIFLNILYLLIFY